MAALTTIQTVCLLFTMNTCLWLAITVDDLTTGQTIALLLLCEFCLFGYICLTFENARDQLFNTIHTIQVYFGASGEHFDNYVATQALAQHHQEHKNGRKANKQKEKPIKGKTNVHIR